jgi:parallel beta-helix repeat protein
VKCISGEDANTILEGFTITGGNANGLFSPDDRGGGMYNESSSPTVTNCTFSGNSAENYGGGIYNYDSEPVVTNCTFTDNEARLSKGGGCQKEEALQTMTEATRP